MGDESIDEQDTTCDLVAYHIFCSHSVSLMLLFLIEVSVLDYSRRERLIRDPVSQYFRFDRISSTCRCSPEADRISHRILPLTTSCGVEANFRPYGITIAVKRFLPCSGILVEGKSIFQTVSERPGEYVFRAHSNKIHHYKGDSSIPFLFINQVVNLPILWKGYRKQALNAVSSLSEFEK